MEAIEQSMGDTFRAFILIILFLFTTIVFVVGGWLSPNGITTDEAFEVVSDTSKYTCIISEADNDLSLNCLETK